MEIRKINPKVNNLEIYDCNFTFVKRYLANPQRFVKGW